METNAAVNQAAEQTPPPQPKKWGYSNTETPGPIQYKKAINAVRDIMAEAGAFRSERDPHVTIYEIFCVNPRPDCVAAYQEIGNRYEWTVTKTNAKKIVADAAGAIATLKAARPVKAGL